MDPYVKNKPSFDSCTCKCDQVWQTESVCKDDELHSVQVRTGTESARVQVLQDCTHATTGGVWK